VAGGLMKNKPEPVPYRRGSWGPEEAGALAGQSGWILGQ
jgi:glucose-6-phosphate 1-dehydrogenase